jgi:hypothetical protein
MYEYVHEYVLPNVNISLLLINKFTNVYYVYTYLCIDTYIYIVLTAFFIFSFAPSFDVKLYANNLFIYIHIYTYALTYI